jgi:hypothetical protein
MIKTGDLVLSIERKWDGDWVLKGREVVISIERDKNEW